MRDSRTPHLLLAAVLIAACGQRPEPVTTPQIDVTFELLENIDGGTYRAAFLLENRGPGSLDGAGWEMFFNLSNHNEPTDFPASVTISRINGDLFRLAPTTSFEPVPPGGDIRLEVTGTGSLIKESDALAGPYFVFHDETANTWTTQAVQSLTVAGFLERGTPLIDASITILPTTESRFTDNLAVHLLPPEQLVPILPTPRSFRTGDSHVSIDSSWQIVCPPDLLHEAEYLAQVLVPLLGEGLPIRNEISGDEASAILLRIESLDEPLGGYGLVVAPGSPIEIVGADAASVFHGIQSLRALIAPVAYGQPSEAVQIREIAIEDAPRFGYRGLHLDVARNFQSQQQVLKLLDLMAFYKLNRFHFHLSDDEGWRLPIGPLPELTGVGGRRGHTTDEADRLVPSYGSGPDPDVANGSGHYSRSDFLEILRWARDRHIEVVPEIDLPGHARAAIKAMEARYTRLSAAGSQAAAEAFLLRDPQDRSEFESIQGWRDNVVDACLPSTYHFIETVVDEIVALFAEAEAPLTTIHIGGDEVPKGVWEKSPACDKLLRDDPDLNDASDLWRHFIERTADILSARGLTVAGWEEIGLEERHDDSGGIEKSPNPELLARKFQLNIWNTVWGSGVEDLGYRLANAGYPVVLSNASNLYFDLAYDRDPAEPGYLWAGSVDTRKAWEFVPFDWFRSAREDQFGHPIDSAVDFVDHIRPTPIGRDNILGIQGQVWAENAKGASLMEYLTFPKLLGLAERAWAADPAWAAIEDVTERRQAEAAAWNEFANRLGQRELPRLDVLVGGVEYRLPPPGGVVEDGILKANVAFPGLAIHYTTDGTQPTVDSPRFEGPVPVQGEIRLRTFDTRGRGSRVAGVRASD